MDIDAIFAHYNSLDPHREISKNSPDSVIVTVDYSQFKTICSMSSSPNSKFEVRMADFKVQMFNLFNQVAAIVGNKSMVIRMGKKPTYFEVYDTMLKDLDEDKIQKVYSLFEKHGLIDNGFSLMVVTFIMPLKAGQIEPDKKETMMIKYCPKTEDPNQFFGYIL